MNIFCTWKRQALWGPRAECYEPNVFVCWRPNLKYNAIWRWALWWVIELSCLDHGALGWDPCPCKKKLQLSLSLSTPWRHREERAICRLGRGLSLRSQSTNTLKLDFPGSRIEKNKCLSLWYFVIAAQADYWKFIFKMLINCITFLKFYGKVLQRETLDAQ